VRRYCLDRARPALRVELETELRRDHHAIATGASASPTSFFVRERAVDLAVSKNGRTIDRCAQQRDPAVG